MIAKNFKVNSKAIDSSFRVANYVLFAKSWLKISDLRERIYLRYQRWNKLGIVNSKFLGN